MGRETKFGLLVGVVFIVLFGVILSSRAGSAANDHAMLPTGAVGAHNQLAGTNGHDVDPFMTEPKLSLQTPPAPGTPGTPGTPVVVVPVEHPLTPAPKVERLAMTATDTPAEPVAPAPKPDQVGVIAFGPVNVTTPVDGGPGAGRGEPELEVGVRPRGTVTPTATTAAPVAANLTIHVVKPGETLISIAKKYAAKDVEVTWQTILAANKTVLRDEKHLAVGQKLVIPVLPALPRKDAPAAAPATAPAAPAAPETPRKDGPRSDVGETVIVNRAPATTAPHDVTPGELRGILRLPPETPVAAVPSAPTAGTYTVEAGDTYMKISQKVYGESKYAKQLAAKNAGLVPDEKKMKVGSKILLLDPVAASVPAPTPETMVAAGRPVRI